jgi:hypothetical protein
MLVVALTLFVACSTEQQMKAQEAAQQACAALPAAQAATVAAEEAFKLLPPGTDKKQAKADLAQAQRILAHLQALCALVPAK